MGFRVGMGLRIWSMKGGYLGHGTLRHVSVGLRGRRSARVARQAAAGGGEARAGVQVPCVYGSCVQSQGYLAHTKQRAIQGYLSDKKQRAIPGYLAHKK